MADSREVLTELFERELARVEQFAPVKIEVIYMPPADYRRETLRTWRREDPKDAWAFGDAAPYRTKLITTIIELAEQRAEHDGTGTKKLFRVVVHQAGGERVPGTFTVLPMFDGADAALERDEHGDAASPTGTLAMVMRQNRDLHKAILARAKQDERLLGGIASMVNSLTKHQENHNGHLWDRIEFLESQKTKQAELVEEAKTMSHERMIEAKVVESEQERKDKALEMFETIGKTIVTHLATGRAQLPASGGGSIPVENGKPGLSELPTMLSYFIGSLGSEQRTELLERLTMEQKLALAELQKASMAGDVAGAYRYVSRFFAKLDEPTVDMLEEVLTGKQKKLLDRIFDLVQETPAPAGANGHSNQPEATS